MIDIRNLFVEIFCVIWQEVSDNRIEFVNFLWFFFEVESNETQLNLKTLETNKRKNMTSTFRSIIFFWKWAFVVYLRLYENLTLIVLLIKRNFDLIFTKGHFMSVFKVGKLVGPNKKLGKAGRPSGLERWSRRRFFAIEQRYSSQKISARFCYSFLFPLKIHGHEIKRILSSENRTSKIWTEK